MTIQDIALFKSYIESNVLREIYLRNYRKSAVFAKNPASIEEFLRSVEPEKVITSAVKSYTANSNYGYDFWQNANENWLVFLRQGRSRHSYTDYHKLMELEGMFKVLRENWDAVKAWLYEPVEEALLRLGLKEEENEPESEEKEEEVNTSKEPLDEISDFSGVPEFDDEFEFFNLTSYSRTRSNKLGDNEVSLNFRNDSYKIIFNQTVSKKAQNNGYKYVRLGKTKNGDVILQLHKQEEASRPVYLRYTSRSSGGNANACINSKDLCEKLKVLLNLTGEYFILHVEELSSNIEKANYKISK